MLLALEANSEFCQLSEMKLFAKIVKIKSRLLFLQKPPFSLFDKVLNMPLNWLPKLRMFYF